MSYEVLCLLLELPQDRFELFLVIESEVEVRGRRKVEVVDKGARPRP